MKDSLFHNPPEIVVEIQRLSHGKDLPYPTYMTEFAVGLDVFAAVENEETILPQDIFLCPTGFKVAIPPSFEIQIRPRSGLAIKKGLTIVNAPGTIDPDYRGEVKIGLINLGKDPVTIKRGDRVAQMVLMPRFLIRWKEVDELSKTQRDAGGFGHTGVSFK
ncbi:Deoxyuridine 5'-triphosphate nucleotidohydrolase [Dissulfuribacter thermophilus]|uniref:Deoxyuridine 5'-triphosphate nucleotidohydrolase n=1 Tax=Dissulfuribacter thermophilus TaxID=1156395 RepID=A0A1B9F678_9BACT|nr:dUTP diphosphatase [Dissulfuribacter thermophilus]OCC15447.1 Deoxyuridine 5'-triphosphate nucleotidohydrolase [Dissulfuribacter thermophilus]